MTRVLIAEDSTTQAVQIRGLLEEAGFEVDVADNGRAALSRLEAGQPCDLVLTDMMMPAMDGLELVRAIRVHHAGLPVILITAQGTDALAIEALEEGASGYVPKSQVSRKLVDEIRRVLHAARVNRSYEVLLGCLTHNEFSFELRNDASLIDPLVDLLQQMMVGVQLCDWTERVRVGLALEHALLNAIYRGNLEISPDEMLSTRELLIQGAGPSVAERRLSEAPFRDRKVYVHVQISRNEARFVIRDEGPGFDTTKVPDPGDADVLEREGGHGLLLMQTFMDEVTFNPSGNEVTLVKRGLKL
jgi:DNA-binding response OmpR family regulator